MLEIRTFKRQIDRQRRDLFTLRTAGLPFVSAEMLLQRMHDRATRLRRERDLLKRPCHHPTEAKPWDFALAYSGDLCRLSRNELSPHPQDVSCDE